MKMLLHEQDHVINQITLAGIDNVKMFFVIDEKCEIMIQAHAGESEVVYAVS